jgi:hypothetical protein
VFLAFELAAAALLAELCVGYTCGTWAAQSLDWNEVCEDIDGKRGRLQAHAIGD